MAAYQGMCSVVLGEQAGLPKHNAQYFKRSQTDWQQQGVTPIVQWLLLSKKQ
jgi:hypothetical protein